MQFRPNACLVDVLRFDDYSVSQARIRKATRLFLPKIKDNRVSLIRDYRDTQNRRKRIAVSSVKFGISRQAVADVGQPPRKIVLSGNLDSPGYKTQTPSARTFERGR
ncbi:hypothetical protein ALC53_04694 [Atta colombica]|uniref:Uncharacterized protein n=1 Tax=Atta colombica TaxID=520822 RepID=A0A195BJT7_9HYME|nr:hypothetical protein ALC53_04694 [Atta colombica]